MEDRIIQLTSELVAIPTHEREGPAQELLASWLTSCGFTCELDEVAPGRPNLIAQRPGARPKFLCSHVDVHPPHGHHDPFTCRREGDELVGRGVVDAKGQIAALVAALEAEPDAGALVLITCDEETGGLGSEKVSLPNGPWIEDGGIVLEPTGFAFCTAQAGHIDLRIAASAPSGHAYAPEPAGSAIKALLSAIEELDTCRFLRAEHVLVGRPRVNIGRIEGGEHPWRTPGHAELVMSLGVCPGTELTDARIELTRRLDQLRARWSNRGTDVSYEITDQSEPIEVASDLPVVSWLADAPGTPLHPGGMPSWTDAGNLLVRHDLPCVVFGAGDLRVAHSDRETVAIADLVRLFEILRSVLRTS